MPIAQRIVIGAWLVLAASIAAGADTTAAPVAEPRWTGVQAELVALSDAWIAAEVGHDRAALERIVDERFLATGSSGETMDRTAYIEWILGMELEPFTVRNEEVRVFGDTGLVISSTMSHKTKFTWIAVRQGGTWRVISETFTRVEAP
jgi:hypothetical protein